MQKRWQWPKDEPPLHLSVNVSANDLADAQLVDDIIDACGQTGAGLMLEVTETDVMREPERVAEALPRLRAQGIRISVDDFGAGHSSLVNLRRLRSEEHTSELQSLMRTSYAVFCLKKKTTDKRRDQTHKHKRR